MSQQDLVLYNFESLFESFLNFLSSPIVITASFETNIVPSADDEYTMQYYIYLMYNRDRGTLEQNIDKGFTAISKDVQTLLSFSIGEEVFIHNNVKNTNLITEIYKEFIEYYYPDDYEIREQSRVKAKELIREFRSSTDWSCWIINIPTEENYETVYVFIFKDQNAKAEMLNLINHFLSKQKHHNVEIKDGDLWDIFNFANSN